MIFAIAMSVRLVHHAMVSGTACLAINRDPISDMEAFHRWAMTIREGDWLGRPGYHPWHPWQGAIAPEATWKAWYGEVFHQEPFYPYLIAVCYLVLAPGYEGVIVLQMIWGAAGCAAIYLAGRRAATETAGLAAGCLAAFYGPFLFYESLLLRDAILIGIHAVLLWAVLEARAAAPGRGATLWWLATGIAGGCAYITKASIAPFLVLCLVFALRGPRGRVHAGALAAGFLALLLPVVARNGLVGAPALKITTRGPIEFINGNNPWHPGTGWFDGDDRRVSAYAHDVLMQADGRLLPTVRRVLSDWSAQPGGFVELQVRKAGFFLAPFEMPNNASYSYFRSRVLLLRALPSFLWIAPPALLGFLVSLSTRPWRRRVLPVHLFLLCGTVVTVAFYVIARFRAPLMPAVLIFAGLGVSESLRLARSGSMAGRLAAVSILVLAFLVEGRFDYPDRALIRPQDYIVAIDDFRQRGRLDMALREAEDGRALFPRFALFHRETGMLHAQRGARDAAIAALHEALSLDPNDALARAELDRLQRPRHP